MTREDISTDLVHFIRGQTQEEAAKTLQKILREGRLLGSSRYIKGSHTCVCFSEAPVAKYAEALLLPLSHEYNTSEIPYQPFGITISKAWLFGLGGRPVIYQSDEEYYLLPEQLRWRHVRYEPNKSPPIDFSWEREWRIQTDALRITPNEAAIVVPHPSWEDHLRKEHDAWEWSEAEMWSQVLGDLAYGMRGPFPWHISVVTDLG